ncbi:MAG: hypothetical protein K2H09_05360 [Treponemataceae bacterium]|nr:hypothetical protein [Treponemataceae bacterium]
MTWERLRDGGRAAAAFDVPAYHRILSPDVPAFLEAYAALPAMRRLDGVGLLCGTDWTPLYRNRFYYSRLQHSIGVALIVWHFTGDKVQTLAGLLHDIAAPVFSHVADFMCGDALTQRASERGTERLIQDDGTLRRLLATDGIPVEAVCDYHRYPVADNEIPRLSADRLEYMFPSGAALHGQWTLPEIAEAYGGLLILQNEDGAPEIGFRSVEAAAAYCERFCMTGHVLQLNENKLALQLLAEIMKRASRLRLISEADCFSMSEADVLESWEAFCRNWRARSEVDFKTPKERREAGEFVRLFRTFRTMTEIVRSDKALDGHFCVNLRVKQRYIDPLVLADGGTFRAGADGSGWSRGAPVGTGRRLSERCAASARLIQDFLSYQDAPFGCVRLVEPEG